MVTNKKKSKTAIAEAVDHAVTALKRAGLRITIPRKQVLATLAASTKPLSATEIIALASKSSPQGTNTDKVTVYRILDTFSEHGLVHQLSPDGRYILCEHHSCSTPLHALLKCSRCRSISEVHIPQSLASSIDSFLSTYGSTRDAHALELQIVCRTCEKRNSP